MSCHTPRNTICMSYHSASYVINKKLPTIYILCLLLSLIILCPIIMAHLVIIWQSRIQKSQTDDNIIDQLPCYIWQSRSQNLMTLLFVNCPVIYDSPDFRGRKLISLKDYLVIYDIPDYRILMTTLYKWLLCCIYDSPDFRICKWMTISLIDNLLSYMAFQITLVTTRWDHSYLWITLSYMTVQASSVVWWWETSSRLMMASSRRNKKNWKQMSMG